MKALSLWQPWASLWGCTPRKRHETRHWKTERRGWLLVHAAKIQVCSAMEKSFGDNDADLERFHALLVDQWGIAWPHSLPYGALVGAVYLADVIPTEDVRHTVTVSDIEDELLGDFTPGRFAWLKSDYRAFEKPIPYKGRQNIFDVPNNIVEGLVPEGKRA